MANRRPQREVRIKGIVKLADTVRDALTQGIPLAQVVGFCAAVRRGLQQIERLCRANGLAPEDLPAPSRRAYVYLKAVDLTALPPPRSGARPSASALRLKGFVARSERVQRMLTEAALHEDDAIDPLTAQLRADVDALAAVIEDCGRSVGDLALPSHRAYQWLTFLTDPVNLARHLEALRRFNWFLAVESGDQRRISVRMEGTFYFTSTLYTLRSRGGVSYLRMHEGFIAAPDEVMAALARIARHAKAPQDNALIRDYAASDNFAEIQGALDGADGRKVAKAQGQAHDLVEVFERVNRRHFANALSLPRLGWSAAYTTRKLGHYNTRNDEIILSRSLDDLRVPDYVLDSVMYHELLHRVLGVQTHNGRRSVHTPEFRQLERAFPRYDEARAFLRDFMTLSRPKERR